MSDRNIASTSYAWRANGWVSATTPQRTAALEQALDAIAASVPEGPALLEYARDQAGQPLMIEETTGPSHAVQGGARIGINFAEINEMHLSTPQGWQRMSLTSALVHELFHIADGSPLFDQFNIVKPVQLFLGKLVISESLSTGERRQVIAELMRELAVKTADPLTLAASPTLQNIDIKTLQPRIASALGIDPQRFQLATLTPANMQENLQRALYESSLLREEKATDYTDAFMFKHFTNEPLRHEYRNGCDLPADASTMPVVPTRRTDCVVSQVDMFLQEVLADRMEHLPRLPWNAENRMDAPFPLQHCPGSKKPAPPQK